MQMKGSFNMSYKKQFIKFMCESGVLTFGEFTLKSGRISPYFMNSGNYNTGEQIAKLGEYYAALIKEKNITATTLFGPAYKGIPLAVTTATALYNNHGIDMNYTFNRKEVKDHGEGGVMVGYGLKDGDSVIMIDDVITSGAALRECIPILQSTAKVDIKFLVISVDRMEKGKEKDSELSAVQQVFNEFGIDIFPIVTLNDIIDAIENNDIPYKEYLPKMIEYRNKYGV